MLPMQLAVVVATLGLHLWTFRLLDAADPLKNARKGLMRATAYTVVASTTWHMIAQTNPRYLAAVCIVL
jgi:hypothetical protein